MKRSLALFLVVFFNSALSLANSFDGCYQLVDTGVMYPAVCISGTTEEGIGGAGARLAIFGTNTNILQACLVSTAIVINEQEFVFEIDGRRELVLNNFRTENGVLLGDATVGNTKIKFVKLNGSNEPLIQSAIAGGCN